MDIYALMRERAFEKRNAAIREARDICRKDLIAIEALARSLWDGGPAPVTQDEPTIHKLLRLLPEGRAFTAKELTKSMAQSNPGLEVNIATVRTYLHKLSVRRKIRKLYKSPEGDMLWVKANSKATGGDFGAMLVSDVVETILRETGKPMTPTELAVALQHRGYRADTNPRTVMRSIKAAIKRSPGRFEGDGKGRWTLNS